MTLQCERLINFRGHRSRCTQPATAISVDRTQPPRLECAYHNTRKARHGYTDDPTDLAQLDRSLLMTYLQRCEQYRTYCAVQVTRFLEHERDAGCAVDAARRMLSATIEQFEGVTYGP